jgi:hypothetical protein
MNATDTYRAALAGSDAAFHAYNPIRLAYHAGTVQDAQFLAARAIYQASLRTFDDAWREAAKANVFMDQEA